MFVQIIKRNEYHDLTHALHYAHIVKVVLDAFQGVRREPTVSITNVMTYYCEVALLDSSKEQAWNELIARQLLLSGHW